MAAETITVYGTRWCGDCYRAKEVLDRHHVTYKWIDMEADAAAQEVVLRLNRGMRSVPTIVFPDGSVLVEPSNEELVARIEALHLGET